MKRRFPEYMCDSLGDSNQAGVHFLGIGSQLRGAAVPRVIKHSQPVIDCTAVITANVPGQEKKFVKLKGGESWGFCPLRTVCGAHGMSGTCTQTWVTEQTTSALLHARHGDNTLRKAGWFTKISGLPS